MKLTTAIMIVGLVLVGMLAAAPTVPNPDFTSGEPLPESAKKDWTLGATGARGWMHSDKQSTSQSRQIYITAVAEGSPASGVLQKGDVLLGVDGRMFTSDARPVFGKALTAAEAGDGQLAVIRWRHGKTEEAVIELPVLGSYSETAPYDCPKSAMILERSCAALAKRMQDPEYEKSNAIVRSLNGLGLLASGERKYDPLLKREAVWASQFSTQGFAVWWYGYATVFLSEYVMATGDTSVLPGLRRMAVEASEGQSAVGSWGHRFAGPDGRLYGYGMMNSPGAVMTLGLVLAREAGVDDPVVTTAIERSERLLRFYIGKGALPYGDHSPYMAGHEDNGKCGMAAVLFDQLGNEQGARFFAKMSTAAHGNERDMGHTGNYFNLAWAMPGVSRGGPRATGAWMEEFGAWYFDLARGWDGNFRHQGPAQQKDDSYASWDATGVYLIAYAMPRKAIRLTGSKASAVPPFGQDVVWQLIRDGNIEEAANRFSAFSSWSPIVRERAAKALAGKNDASVDPFILLLDDPSLDARLGACTALAALGSRAEPAIPKLREMLKSDEMWLRVKAVEALAAIGKPAMPVVPELLKMLAKGATPEDPRGMEQRYIAEALFHPRLGMLTHSLDGVDRPLLLAAIDSGLKNEDGRTRGVFAQAYRNLSLDDVQPILPGIHQAILQKSPSGIMFDGQIQTAGLDMLSSNHVSEGIELLADYVRLQKKHGSEKHIHKLLDMLKRYGAHAQRAIPQLEKAIDYFENEESDYPRDMSLKKAEAVRQAIREIQQMTEKPELRELNL